MLAGGALDRVHRPPTPAWGLFYGGGAVAGGCAAAFFLERACFGTGRVPVARGRVPKPGRRLGGNCQLAAVYSDDASLLARWIKARLIGLAAVSELYGLRLIYLVNGGVLTVFRSILRRHSFQHDSYSHLRGRGVPAARPRLGGAAGQRFCHCAGALAVYHGAASGCGVCAGACGACRVSIVPRWRLVWLGGKKSFAVVLA